MGAKDRIRIRELDAAAIDEALAWRMEVLDTVFAADEPWPHEELREANAAFLEEHLGSDLVYGIASIDGEDIGSGALCIQPELPSPDNPRGLAAYVMNIYTRKSHRGIGVGHAMVTWLISKAEELGIEKIYLETTDEGYPLYEGLGFIPMESMMKLDGSRTARGE